MVAKEEEQIAKRSVILYEKKEEKAEKEEKEEKEEKKEET